MSRRPQLQPSDTAPEQRRERRWPRALAATAAGILTTAALAAAAVGPPSAFPLPQPARSIVEATDLLGVTGSVEKTASNAAGKARTDAKDASHGVDAHAVVRSERDVLMKRAQAERQRAAMRPSRGTSRTNTDKSSRRPPPRPPAWLRGCAAQEADDARSHSNGQVPSTELCPLPISGHLLHADAAYGWWRLNRAFTRRFGSGICVTDSYRSYGAQSAVYNEKPGLAAVPGTSNHGWGVALDLCGGVESYASPQHVWLAEQGEKYGWVNPSWAQAGGSRPEPWHWEFVGR